MDIFVKHFFKCFWSFAQILFNENHKEWMFETCLIWDIDLRNIFDAMLDAEWSSANMITY